MTKGMREFDYDFYLSWPVWEPILCLAVLCSALAFSLWVSSIKTLGVAKSSIFQAMIPVVTAIAGVVLGNELLTSLQWCGIGIAIAGLILTQTVCKRKA
jgi:drug/metabolite transporter (DMT)-like permease